jgi:hypothetical protein
LASPVVPDEYPQALFKGLGRDKHKVYASRTPPTTGDDRNQLTCPWTA